jgi:L-amino acid N-acyltransferase YncA
MRESRTLIPSPSPAPPPEDGYHVRPARPSDWESISRLLAGASLPLEGARDHLAGFVVAEREGTIVGCAAVERYDSAGLLRSVAVLGSERGRGLGQALVERCLTNAEAVGIPTLVLLTTAAEGFFPRFGFRPIDRASVPEAVRESAEFRGACPASAIVMRLELASPLTGGARGLSDALSIRAARDADAAAIAEIYNEGIRGRLATFETRERTPGEIQGWLATPRFPVLVAERAGRMVGWVAASEHSARECYAGIAEFSVYVRADERGRRVGDALMRAFIPALEGAGFWKVLSRIFPENGPSLALCRRHGFREVGVYQKHARLDGAWPDVVIVERLLGEAARP